MDAGRKHGHQGGLGRLLAGQRRRHLVAQLMTAQRWARALEGALTRGDSPTGYGRPLTPMPLETAQALLQPVQDAIVRLREFVAEQAPEELAQAERPQPPQQTSVWARNLLERIADTIEGLTEELSTAESGVLVAAAARLAEDVHPLLDRARDRLSTVDSA